MIAPKPPCRSRAAILCFALALAGTACDEGAGEPTAVVRPPATTPAVDAAPAGAPLPAANPTLIAAGPPVALTPRAMSPVRRPDASAMDFRPGRWSPDGTALVAWQVVDTAASAPVGRAWLVSAPRDDGTGRSPLPSPLWDSGDVEGPLDARIDQLATWRADGNLAVARSDEMLIAPDGLPAVPVTGLGEQQLRGLLPDPGGVRLLAYGPGGAWIVEEDGQAVAVAGAPAGGADAWAWRRDGSALAVASGRAILVADLAAGAALAAVAQVDATGGALADDAQAAPPADGDAPPAPRWLSDGTLFLGVPSPLAGDRAGSYTYRVINADGTEAVALPQELGRDPSPVPIPGAAAWVSPGGHAVLVPEVVAGPNGPSVRASWLYDVASRTARELPPMVDAVWSPDGVRIAWSEAGAVLVRHLASDRVAVLTSSGAAGSARFAWSPDGHWLLYAGAFGDLWLARADATASPVRVAEAVAWEPVGPTWAPGSDRFAVAVRDSDGTTRFIVAALPAE